MNKINLTHTNHNIKKYCNSCTVSLIKNLKSETCKMFIIFHINDTQQCTLYLKNHM